MNKKHLKATPISGVKCPKCGHYYDFLSSECPQCHAPILNAYESAPTQYIEFGRCRQDYDNNEKRPIRWKILRVIPSRRDGHRTDLLYILSEYIPFRSEMDKKAVENDYEFTWGQSHLRDFLNSVFYERVFDEFEKAAVLSVDNNDDPRCEVVDKVFVPSLVEFSGLRSELGNALGIPTQWCFSSPSSFGDGIDESTPMKWWLRTPYVQSNKKTALCVSSCLTTELGWTSRWGTPYKKTVRVMQKPGTVLVGDYCDCATDVNEKQGVRVALWLDAVAAGVDVSQVPVGNERGIAEKRFCVCCNEKCLHPMLIDGTEQQPIVCSHCGKKYSAPTLLQATERNFINAVKMNSWHPLDWALRNYHPYWPSPLKKKDDPTAVDSRLLDVLPPISLEPDGSISEDDLRLYSQLLDRRKNPPSSDGERCYVCGGIVTERGKNYSRCEDCGTESRGTLRWYPSTYDARDARIRTDTVLKALRADPTVWDEKGGQDILAKWKSTYLRRKDYDVWVLRDEYEKDYTFSII